MDTDFAQIFDGQEPEPQIQEEPVVVEEVVEVVEPVTEAEPAPEPEVIVQPESVEPPKQETKDVPLGTFLEMRDRAKEAERRAAELEAAQSQNQHRQAIPDPLDDPEGYNAYFEQRARDVEITTRINTSRMIAIQHYGQEEVDSAAQWFLSKVKEDPTFEQRMISQPHPADWVVRQHKREALLSQIGDKDLDTFVREYVSQNGEKLGLAAPVATVAATVPQQQAQAPVKVPRSIASQDGADSDIRHTPTGPLAGVSALFN